MSVLVVTGTGTDVGKTVATAALAVCAEGRGRRRQAGADRRRRRASRATWPRSPGCPAVTDTFEYARYPDPLSPHHAARVSGLPELDFADVGRRIDELARRARPRPRRGRRRLARAVHDSRTMRWTLIDLGAPTAPPSRASSPQPGLGTLNHTALTVEAIAAGGCDRAGHRHRQLAATSRTCAMRCNVADLRRDGPRGALGGCCRPECPR